MGQYLLNILVRVGETKQTPSGFASPEVLGRAPGQSWIARRTGLPEAPSYEASSARVLGSSADRVDRSLQSKRFCPWAL